MEEFCPCVTLHGQNKGQFERCGVRAITIAGTAIPLSAQGKSNSLRDRPYRGNVMDQRRFPVRAKADQNALANLRQFVGGKSTTLWNPNWDNATLARQKAAVVGN
jgi:hypothetical protein